MRTKAPSSLPIFRSELQARLLALLLLDEPSGVTTPQLAARLNASEASLHRELTRLRDAGILEREPIGRTFVYRPSLSSPIHAPLKELIVRTMGVETQLRDVLAHVGGVEAAAIFGSWAAGRIGASSDIDLLVVGDPDSDQLLEGVRRVEAIVGREIDVKVYRRDELRQRQADGSPFVEAMLSGPLVPLVGELT
jgi:predicted nucleotidyltransferase/biotin operon repressor